MNEDLEAYARETLKYNLSCCSKAEQNMFKRMYSHKDMDKPIKEVIEEMDIDKLDWAMQQVKKTLQERK